MGICFSNVIFLRIKQKNDVKPKRKQHFSQPEKDNPVEEPQTNKNNINIISNNIEIAQNPRQEKLPKCNSPSSHRTSLLDPKHSKEDLKSTLKEDKRDIKTDRNTELNKLVLFI